MSWFKYLWIFVIAAVLLCLIVDFFKKMIVEIKSLGWKYSFSMGYLGLLIFVIVMAIFIASLASFIIPLTTIRA